MIGLTGGIASGKSTVGDIIRKLGVVVIDADAIAHQMIEPGTQGYFEIVKEFGNGIVGVDGFIDRKALGSIVFSDEAARKKLESITHPAIIARIKELTVFYAAQNKPMVVVEVPLLFEVGLENLFDYVWVVSVNPELQIERVMKRNQISRMEAEQRIASQLPLNYKEARADAVIDNNRDYTDLELEVSRLVEMFNH